MKLSNSKLLSLLYHDRFLYPMTKEELEKWGIGDIGKSLKVGKIQVFYSKNFYFLNNNKQLISLRKKRFKHSQLKIAETKKAVSILSAIPYIKFVGVTGSLAMRNADAGSDIDLMIITEKGTLWLTRLISYLLLKIYGFGIRKPNDKHEKDRLCLNMWLDENDLVWQKLDRNIYTAHELAQITPVYNKEECFEMLLYQNKWILNYWPKSVKIIKPKNVYKINKLCDVRYLEKLAYWLQYKYMKRKITKEIITETRAIFHPRRLPLDKIFSNF